MPHLCTRRADIPETLLQVIDLVPNNSTKSNILEPAPGQSRYGQQPSNEDVGTINPAASQLLTAAAYTGLAVYLLDNVEDSSGAAITTTVANDTATALIARVRAGSTITLANVNSELITAGATAGTGLTAGNSTGSLQDVLQILTGRPYFVPGGSEVQTSGGAFTTAVAGAFTAEAFVELIDTGALHVSVGGGYLAGFLRTDFFYEGPLTATLGPANGLGAAVVVYNDDGTIFVP